MSPLTKLFVGLLVVLSLLLTAATVTFVNTLDNQRQKAEDVRQLLVNQKQELDSSRAAAMSEAQQAKDAEQLAQGQVEQLRQQSNSSQQLIADRDVKLAEAGSRLAIQGADVTRLSEALKASEDAKSRMQEMIASLRTANDQALQQAAQSSQSISDLTNKLEVTERERRFATEQLEEARNQSTKLGNAVQEMGRDPREILASAAPGGGGPIARTAPRINGIVRDVRTIAGLPYATISVGSADGVTKGTTFNIVERNGAFLGKLTIDTVELNEATGRIAGPNDKIGNVRSGVEVKTQL